MMLSNAHLVSWQSLELKVATKLYVTTAGSTSAIDVTRQLMVMIISGL